MAARFVAAAAAGPGHGVPTPIGPTVSERALLAAPAYAGPTVAEPAYVGPTVAEPAYVGPTVAEPAYVGPTVATPMYGQSEPSTAEIAAATSIEPAAVMEPDKVSETAEKAQAEQAPAEKAPEAKPATQTDDTPNFGTA
jgi:hypothetical protein